jgi:hypothetical protein
MVDQIKKIVAGMPTQIDIHILVVQNTNPLTFKPQHNDRIELPLGIIDIPQHIGSISSGDLLFGLPYDENQRYIIIGKKVI